MRHLRLWAAVTALTIGFGAVSGSPDVPARLNAVSAPATATDSGSLNTEQLGKALENLGYKVEPIRGKDGSTEAYKVTFETNGWNYTLIVEISPSGDFIWLTATLGQVNPGATSAEQLLKILATNARIEPALFCIDEKSHILMMQMPINNKNVSQATLLRWINFFCKSIRDTKDVWSPEPIMPKSAADPARG